MLDEKERQKDVIKNINKKYKIKGHKSDGTFRVGSALYPSVEDADRHWSNLWKFMPDRMKKFKYVGYEVIES